MPESPHEHLTEDELNRYADGEAESSVTAAHVHGCPGCQKRVDELVAMQRKLDALRSAEPASPGADCPDRSDWWQVVRGLASKEDAGAMLAHAARCGHCGRMLRYTIEDNDAEANRDDPLIAALPSSTPDGIADLASRLQQVTGKPKRSASRLRAWLVAAAALVAVVSGILFLTGPTPERANRLLAQAFEERRSSELRIPGAAYSAIRQERGAAQLQSQPFMEAAVIISKELSSHPQDGRWLQSSGRARLLEWRYDEAISDLTKAQALQPGDPSVLGDLAAAYFERAQARDDPADYRTALERWSQAIGLAPKEPELRFNRAIVLEHLSQNGQAIQEWDEFLKLETVGGWADEARARRDELKRKSP